MVRDSLGYAASQLLVRTLMIARTVLAARWLGPHAFGAWNALQLLMDYGALAPLGTQQGLDQMVPRRIVDADPVRLAHLKRAGVTNILVFSLLFCVGWMLYFSESAGTLMQTWGPAGMALAMLIVVLINWANYHTTLLRSQGNIGAVSLWFFLQGTIGALLGLALIGWLGPWGLLWGWTAGTVVAFVWTRWEARGIAPLRPLTSVESVQLLRVGFPLFFFLASTLIMRSLDRLIILRYLGTPQLGYYSLAVTALTLLMYLPDSATYVFYPRLLRRYREAGDDPAQVRDSVVGVLRILVALTPVLGGIVFIAGRDLIQLVLPQFIIGSTAVRVMSFTAAALCISNLASVVLMTLGRQVWLMPAAVVFTLAFAAADIAVLRAGFGISGVAWATFGVYVASGFTLLTFALAAMGFRAGRVLREIGGCLWCIGIGMGLAFLADRFAPGRDAATRLGRVAHMTIGWAAFLVAYCLAVAPQLRGLGIRQIVSEFNLPFASLLRPGPGAAGNGS